MHRRHSSMSGKGRLYISVIAGKDLIIADILSSDPYVKIKLGGRLIHTTKTEKATLNPIWQDEDVVVNISSESKELTLELWDHDDIGKDDWMGIVTVPLEDLVDGVLVNKWFTVHKSKTNDKEWGQLHISLLSAFQYDLGHNTPLYKALSTGKMGPAARLLEQIDDRFDIELKDKDGDIGLHIFIRNCTDPTSVTSILDSFWRIGADFNATTKNGDTPLHLCIQNSAVRGVLVDWLLLHKKSEEWPKGVDFSAKPADDNTIAKLCITAKARSQFITKLFEGGYIPTTEERLALKNHSSSLKDSMTILRILHSAGFDNLFTKIIEQEISVDIFLSITESQLHALHVPDAQAAPILAAITKYKEKKANMQKQAKQRRQRKSSISTFKSFVTESNTLRSNSWLISATNLEFIKEIGQGAFSKVYQGLYHTPSGESLQVAIKVIKPKFLSNPQSPEVENLKKEFITLSTVAAPHVIQFYGVSISDSSISLVMEYCHKGTLFGVLKDESKILDWPTALDYAIGMTKGIVTLHNWEPPIYHRDLKSMNLLVTSTGAIKVTDFGTSHFDTDGNDVSRMQEVGTIAYCAPEVFAGFGFTEKADIYSLGITLWEIMNRAATGQYAKPYADHKFVNDGQLIFQVSNGSLRPTMPTGGDIPEGLVDLVTRCWATDPDQRPIAAEVLAQLQSMRRHFGPIISSAEPPPTLKTLLASTDKKESQH